MKSTSESFIATTLLSPSNPDELPDEFAKVLRPIQSKDEVVLCWVESDLDHNLNFRHMLLVLTNQRLLLISPSGREEEHTLNKLCTLSIRELVGTGILELINEHERLSFWRFTAAQRGPAAKLRKIFEQLRLGEEVEDDDVCQFAALCTSCGKPLAPEQALCPKCEAEKSKQALASLWRLMAFAKPRAYVIALGLALQIFSTIVSLVPPYLTIPMIDDVLIPYQSGQRENINLIWYFLIGLFAAQILSWLLSWARTWVLAWASERISADLRKKTYAHLQSLSLEYFGGRRTGDLISRVSSDTDRICYFLSVHLLDFGSDALMILMTAIILIGIDTKLAIITLIPLPFIGYLVHRIRRHLVEGFSQGSRAWSEMTSVLADTIPGIRVVKAFAQESREVKRFAEVNDLVLKANDRVNTLWSFFSSFVVFLTGVGVLIVWACGAWLVFHSGVKVGVLTGFVQYISRFYGRMDSMSRMVSAFNRAGVAAQRVFSILDRVPGVPEPSHPVHPGRLKGEVELKGVSFHYGPRTVLRNLNLHIKPGEMIGLVGPSGAGKSTLINLICRFYDVSEGAVLVDGQDIRSFPAEAYRRNIGIVLQEPFLFYGTISDNISYGRPAAAREELIHAARAARAHEFILKLSDGYDSIVGERGQSLSGGERQRISIARALLINPSILVLDEATSSVDNTTEQEIQVALENLTKGRTTIAIAHRLSTLRRADRVISMEHGKIISVSPPSEVIPDSLASHQVQTRNVVVSSMEEINQIHWRRDSFGRLCISLAEQFTDLVVTVARAFPLSAPNEWISIINQTGTEVVSIRDITTLSEPVRKLLQEELGLREFVPLIKQIVHAETDSTPLVWKVVTDRGPTTFYLDSDDDMRRLGENAAIFIDSHGIRYLIRDFSALDSHSRKIIAKFF